MKNIREGEWLITVEEIEIIVTAKVEEALKEFNKIVPSVQKKITGRQMKLDIIDPQMDKIVNDTRNQVVPDRISKNDKSMDTVVNNALASNKDFTSLDSQAQKLYSFSIVLF